jgi:hypothetical protein
MNDFSGFGVAVLFVGALVALYYFARAADERIQPLDDWDSIGEAYPVDDESQVW